MPIYEYQCQGCGSRIEVKQKVTDPPLTTCERCNGSLTKLISAPGIMFKGSGWYVTDYSDKMKPPTDAAQPAASSDAKPADKKAPDKSSEASPAQSQTAPPAASPASASSGSAPAKTSSTGST